MGVTDQIETHDPVDSKLVVEVLVKEQYGRRVFKPNCVNALRFAAIAGTQTLTERVLRNIMELGYTVHFLHEQVYLKKADIDIREFKL